MQVFERDGEVVMAKTKKKSLAAENTRLRKENARLSRRPAEEKCPLCDGSGMLPYPRGPNCDYCSGTGKIKN